jgi:hypothetical protein
VENRDTTTASASKLVACKVDSVQRVHELDTLKEK